MKKFRNKIIVALTGVMLLGTTSCEKFYDINQDPANIKDAPLQQLLTSATVNVGFMGGSDLLRYSSLISQQFSGQSPGAETQQQQYEKYLISGSDVNNIWSNIYATTLTDLDLIISKSNAANSPHYAGVAKLLKAYIYQVAVDTWGNIPYSEAHKYTANLAPKYDTAQSIYASLITLIDEAIVNLNAGTSTLSPGANSTIYSGSFTTTRANWIKFANTLKLRIFLHYSEQNAAFATSRMNQLIASNATFFAANADNFEMPFQITAGAQNPIYQFETGSRKFNLVANKTLVDMMNTKVDPRRATYFTTVNGAYVGAVGGAASNPTIYSMIHTYLKGTTGEAPVRLLTFAEYNFIRAEAALRFGVTGNAQTFFEEGIKASMAAAGVSAADVTTYLAANGTLTGTNDNKLKQIIEEKFVASYGVMIEPWTDWRRTGYPSITKPSNAVVDYIPRSLFYPQSEIDLNPSNVTQKAGMNVRVFWDTKQ